MTASAFDFGLLIEAEDLVPHLGHEKLRIVDLSRASVYEQLHIPHALHLQPKLLVRQEETAMGLLPDAEGLEALIRYLNISPEHHVVAYDDEGGAWAGRLLWNLHCLGFENTSLLNGGIHAWLGAGLPTSSDQETFTAVDHLVPVNLERKAEFQIDYNELKQLIENENIQVWDCRTEDEYTGLRLAARRGGHIPGTRHFEWSTALNYDGAWSEWGNRLDSPIATGEVPS